MSRILIYGLLVSVFVVSCKNESDDSRINEMELELRQKELEYKKKQQEIYLEERRELKEKARDDLSRLYDVCQKSVFMIEDVSDDPRGEFIGSGFFLTSDGIGVTNHHVWVNAGLPRVRIDDSKVFMISHVICSDPELDYVVFRIEKRDSETVYPVTIADALPKIGEDCFAIGNPLRLRRTLSKGIVSGYRGEYIQTTAQITYGSSGGALFNKDGEAIGITTAGKEEADINFALIISNLDCIKEVKRVNHGYKGLDGSLAEDSVKYMEEVVTRLMRYYQALEVHNYEELKRLFADNLKRFYKRENVSMVEAIREHRRYAKTYPHPRTVVYRETINIKRYRNGNASIYFKIKNTIKRKEWNDEKSYRFIVYIGIDRAMRIESVYSRIID